MLKRYSPGHKILLGRDEILSILGKCEGLSGIQGIEFRALQTCKHMFLTTFFECFFKARSTDGQRDIVIVNQGFKIFFDRVNRVFGGASHQFEVLLYQGRDPGPMFGSSVF